jgi:hypothetical protein
VETIFTLSNLLVLPFWLVMIVLPGWRWTERIIRSPLVVAPNAVLYAELALPRLGPIVGSFDSLASVAALLGRPPGATIAWIHFLAFDLFVGRWIYLDGRRRGVHPLLMAPALLLTFMLGPLGYLAYPKVRQIGTAVPTRDLHHRQSEARSPLAGGR